MVTIPAKVKERLISGIKKFQPIVHNAQVKDINESDTVTIISDMLSDIFGYNKYSEITSEFAIKKTFCDLAIQIDGATKLLIETKAAGLDLKDPHIKQAVDYGANSGISWVVLTNGVIWKVYSIIFAKPVTAELVYEFNFTSLNHKRQNDLELLYYLTKESIGKGNKSSLDDYHAQQQLINKFTIGQIIMSEPIIDSIRKTIRKILSDTKVSNEEILKIITDEVIKREVLEGEKASEAKKKVGKALKPINNSPKPEKILPIDTQTNS